MLIREMQLMGCVRFNSGITCVMLGMLKGLEPPVGPTAGAVEELPVPENEWARREVAN